MEKIADKILDLIDDVRWTKHELDYLAWTLINQSPAPLRRRVQYLGERLIHHHNTTEEHHEQDRLF